MAATGIKKLKKKSSYAFVGFHFWRRNSVMVPDRQKTLRICLWIWDRIPRLLRISLMKQM